MKFNRTASAVIIVAAVLAPATAGAVDPPPNDDIVNAIDLTAGVEQRFNLQGATIEVDEVACDADPTSWFSFTAVEAGDYVSYVTGSNYDSEIGWFSDFDTDTGDCPDDAYDSYDAVEAMLSFTAGEQEYVQIGAHSEDDLGTGSVGVVAVLPAVDAFADAPMLTKVAPDAPSAVLGLDLTDPLTSEIGESTTCGATTLDAGSGWVDFVPDSSGTWMIESKSYEESTLAVYAGSSVDDLELLHCATENRTAVLADMTQGQTYRIRVTGESPVVLRAERAPVLAAASLVDDDGSGASTGVGQASSLAVINGVLAVAYYDETADALRYAERADNGSWVDVLVDADGDGSSTDLGASVALVETGSGHPGIAYYDATAESLRYAERGDNGSWVDVLVDADGDGSSTSVGGWVAIALLPSGQPGIAYSDDDAGALRFAERDASGAWSDVLVDADGDGTATSVGQSPSIAVAPTGEIGISYDVGSDGSLRLAERAGAAWTDSLVIDVGDASADGSSLRYTPDGSPVIAVSVSEFGSSAHHTVATRSAGAWSYETDLGDRALAELDYQCVPPVLLLDDVGSPFVIWMDCNYAGTLAVSRSVGGTWVTDDLFAYDTNPNDPDFAGSIAAWNSSSISGAWTADGRLAVTFQNGNAELWFAEEVLFANAGGEVGTRTFEGVNLDGAQSTDGFGSIASYAWSVPGCVVTDADNAMASAACSAAGEYTATLVVTDTDGNTSTDTAQIVVVDPRPADDEIYRLYQAAFGRAPDAEGLAFWQGRYQTGSSLSAIADEFRSSPEFVGLYGADPSNDSFIDALYLNVLGRAGDAEGRAFWLDRLNSDATDQTAVLMAFSASPENIARTDTSQPLTAEQSQIFRLYRAAFGRLAEEGGFNFWTQRYVDGTPLTVIALEFRVSDEFQARFGDSLSDEEFVDLLYQNVLGRPGEASGRSFWLSRLGDDLASRESVLVSFSESPENIAGTGTVPAS